MKLPHPHPHPFPPTLPQPQFVAVKSLMIIASVCFLWFIICGQKKRVRFLKKIWRGEREKGVENCCAGQNTVCKPLW